ncbi:MAG: ferrous iron transport protein A [Paracoccus sp. (in: a-proteobacteria)]
MELTKIEALGQFTALGTARRGFRGRIVSILPVAETGQLPAEEMERRLIEMGFLEGAEVEIVHEAPFGRDPIAVRVGSATVALHRRDAMAILTE